MKDTCAVSKGMLPCAFWSSKGTGPSRWPSAFALGLSEVEVLSVSSSCHGLQSLKVTVHGPLTITSPEPSAGQITKETEMAGL